MTRLHLERTTHGDQRAIDRNIPELAIQLLRDYGIEKPAGGGATRYDFDKRSWKEVEQLFGKWRLKEMEKLRRAYLIVTSEDRVITVSFRN
ncbi:MAG: hypothetical protein COW58_06515 [Thalassolituus sp. CG17_big_fil_post_rev_8_21_14_2_50_53_8]|nr:MAG: hypothetical protein COW58_06515 [Thalassolituus sp. CG17_big_fil_post_rev_8_21_14_2_50_53_8]